MREGFFLSAKLIPLFYVFIGIIFICFPEFPQMDIAPLEGTENKLALLFTQEIGLLFVVFAILGLRIYMVSKEIYAALNGSMLLVVILLSLIGPYFYDYTMAPEFLMIFCIHLFFIFFLLKERHFLIQNLPKPL
jgi:hypothetical protein|tara:strand:+ start:1202 stop:1603 length:402 start_codon:yes stop_codon:yes gene_type:complete